MQIYLIYIILLSVLGQDIDVVAPSAECKCKSIVVATWYRPRPFLCFVT